MKNNSIGKLGENIAIQFLLRNDYTILETNYANSQGKRLGEIDIVARRENTIHFIEVKTRTSNKNTDLPEQAIGKTKLLKIKKISQYFIERKNMWHTNHQFDAISVIIEEDKGTASVRHLKNIFL